MTFLFEACTLAGILILYTRGAPVTNNKR